MTALELLNDLKKIDVEAAAKKSIDKNSDYIISAFEYQTATGFFGKEYSKNNKKRAGYKYFAGQIPSEFNPLVKKSPSYYDFFVTGDFFSTFDIKGYEFVANTDLYGDISALKDLETNYNFYHLTAPAKQWFFNNSTIFTDFKKNLFNKN